MLVRLTSTGPDASCGLPSQTEEAEPFNETIEGPFDGVVDKPPSVSWTRFFRFFSGKQKQRLSLVRLVLPPHCPVPSCHLPGQVRTSFRTSRQYFAGIFFTCCCGWHRTTKERKRAFAVSLSSFFRSSRPVDLVVVASCILRQEVSSGIVY